MDLDEEASPVYGVEFLLSDTYETDKPVQLHPLPPNETDRLGENLIRESAEYQVRGCHFFEEVFPEAPRHALGAFLRRKHDRALEQFDLLPHFFFEVKHLWVG
ncbi:MAG: hypothetical protein GY768_27950, partial [Planctomycetaceae bacterium]|nr:hypothetical protein [Planctomycetaceae bacterium]